MQTKTIYVKKPIEVDLPTYPEDFYDYSDGKDIKNEIINEYIEQGRADLENADVGEFWYTACGNALVMIVKYEDEYIYIVTKNYRECSEYRNIKTLYDEEDKIVEEKPLAF